ncbi:peroxiredoxin family protein [Chitinophaga pinensis]|uniref:Alkyl hydroperoxide reductase/ Thiol specific antioxidant/ Mal allergen n=1 Tax=Chitinophaga pinensis (strain ATCC 43595 / DSM 2588 / LMG 13176 / NBRC 15968 / NCIMB 11800 / UQM 2034) TaxID=485918 RepID=A0A979G878_CHIPD|nr:TlpA disulfide reductase family protein [Chitinophaga pinensis]ACU62575.1 alkyl hydroperoxide reductase/ Thiol specific antioxidant/ Mal allergen [Chitinophaga pinensis DSM 2588]
MKNILLLTLVCGLGLHTAAQDTTMLSAQKKELTGFLADADAKLATCQQQYYDAQKAKGHYDTIGLGEWRYQMKLLKSARKAQEINFIRQHPDYMVSLDALKDVIGPLPDNIKSYNALYNGLKKNIRQSEAGINTKKMIDKYMTVRVGAIAPAFTAPDTSGQNISLKDYRGKYVLIDFWASWCGPCREENPAVVKAYQQYKDKNFDILSVSLDQPGKRAEWIKAIQKDGLSWQHVSELKYWDSNVAKLYAIRSIPQNFLVDPKGKIIAKDLRGEALATKLEEILK